MTHPDGTPVFVARADQRAAREDAEYLDWLAGEKLDVPAFCHGCDWADSGYTHRHNQALDGPRAGCCAHLPTCPRRKS